MLDQIERLVGELASVGDDIAHDLRTPLTRVRALLERGRDTRADTYRICRRQRSVRSPDWTSHWRSSPRSCGSPKSTTAAASPAWPPFSLPRSCKPCTSFIIRSPRTKACHCCWILMRLPPWPGDHDLLLEAVAIWSTMRSSSRRAGFRGPSPAATAPLGPWCASRTPGPASAKQNARRCSHASTARTEAGMRLASGLALTLSRRS